MFPYITSSRFQNLKVSMHKPGNTEGCGKVDTQSISLYIIRLRITHSNWRRVTKPRVTVVLQMKLPL